MVQTAAFNSCKDYDLAINSVRLCIVWPTMMIEQRSQLLTVFLKTSRHIGNSEVNNHIPGSENTLSMDTAGFRKHDDVTS